MAGIEGKCEAKAGKTNAQKNSGQYPTKEIYFASACQCLIVGKGFVQSVISLPSVVFFVINCLRVPCAVRGLSSLPLAVALVSFAKNIRPPLPLPPSSASSEYPLLRAYKLLPNSEHRKVKPETRTYPECILQPRRDAPKAHKSEEGLHVCPTLREIYRMLASGWIFSGGSEFYF